MRFLDEASQQVLLQRLAGHRSATPKRRVNVVGHVLDLDARHMLTVALFWRYDNYIGANAQVRFAVSRDRKTSTRSGSWTSTG